MSEESISYIWGEQVTGDKPVVIKPSELPAFLIINRAVLVAGSEAMVSISISGTKFAIAKLHKDKKDQTTLDLRFWELSEEDDNESFEISVTPKASKVDLTGYFQQEEDEDYYTDEEDDEAEGPYGPMTVEDVTDADADKALKTEEKKGKKQTPTPKGGDKAPQEKASAKKKGKKGAHKEEGETSKPSTPKQTEKTSAATTTPAATTATTETSASTASVPTESKSEAQTDSTAPTTPTAASEPAGGKKRKQDTPNKGQNKKQKNESVATPTTTTSSTTPSGASSGATTPTTASISQKCADCGRDFKGEKALQAHAKAKHNK